MTLPLLLSQRQAAKVLGVDRGTTLARLVRSGRIRLVLGKVPLEALHRIAAGEIEAPAPEAPKAPPPKAASTSVARTALPAVQAIFDRLGGPSWTRWRPRTTTGWRAWSTEPSAPP